MERFIPLFAVATLNHDRYPGVKSRYLAGYTALVNCDILDISGVLYSKETRQQALGIPSAAPSTTSANRIYNTQTQPPLTGRPNPCPTQPPAHTSVMDYSPPRGVPWKFIAAMMREDKSCPGCHFKKPNDSPRLKLNQEV